MFWEWVWHEGATQQMHCLTRQSTGTEEEKTYILGTCTHGTPRDIPNITPLRHVIVHAHVKQQIALVYIVLMERIVGPRKPVTMHRSLNILLPRFQIPKDAKSRIDVTRPRRARVVNVANVGIVRGILVHAIVLIRSVAIPIIIIRLTILRKATIRRVVITPVQILKAIYNFASVRIERFDVLGEFDDLALRLVVVNVVNARSIVGENILPARRLDLVVPLSAAGVVLVVELGALARDVGVTENVGGVGIFA
mmetsp:Transcript_18162/g.29383  ORF Transcript_18162/g.29383 Transcript_18162/m.29383 type:complete len:252 (+) Transcript_18162:478-1233(+)